MQPEIMPVKSGNTRLYVYYVFLRIDKNPFPCYSFLMALRRAARAGEQYPRPGMRMSIVAQLLTTCSENTGIITVRGSLTNRIASDLRIAVDQALRRFSRIILSIENASYIDRDSLQFLCMAHCSASRSRKSFVVAGACAAHPVSCSGCRYDAGSACPGKYSQ